MSVKKRSEKYAFHVSPSPSQIYISDLQVLNLCLFRMRIKYMQNKEIYCNIKKNTYLCNGNKNKTLTICQRLQMKAPLRKADSFGI